MTSRRTCWRLRCERPATTRVAGEYLSDDVVTCDEHAASTASALSIGQRIDYTVTTTRIGAP